MGVISKGQKEVGIIERILEYRGSMIEAINFGRKRIPAIKSQELITSKMMIYWRICRKMRIQRRIQSIFFI